MAQAITKKKKEMKNSVSNAKNSQNAGWHHTEVYLPLTVDFQVDQNG